MCEACEAVATSRREAPTNRPIDGVYHRLVCTLLEHSDLVRPGRARDFLSNSSRSRSRRSIWSTNGWGIIMTDLGLAIVVLGVFAIFLGACVWRMLHAPDPNRDSASRLD